MENPTCDIKLPAHYSEPTQEFNKADYYRLMLTNDQMASHPTFVALYEAHGSQILENTCPALKKALIDFPDDNRLGIVCHYAKAVALRLALFPVEHRASNIEWARFATPKDVREMHYICKGVQSNQACGKANPEGCQEDLKEKFAQLLKDLKFKIQ